MPVGGGSAHEFALVGASVRSPDGGPVAPGGELLEGGGRVRKRRAVPQRLGRTRRGRAP